MLLLTGKTCSGKDTIKKELIKMGMESVITYTTRPPRKKEIDKMSYHFISKDEFFYKNGQGFFAETTSYKVANGDIWYYGTAKKDLSCNKVIIVNPDGLRNLNKINSLNPISFYIMADDLTLWRRLSFRGDDYNEAKRRVDDDKLRFENIYNDVDFCFRNDIDKITPSILADLILTTYKKVIKIMS